MKRTFALYILCIAALLLVAAPALAEHNDNHNPQGPEEHVTICHVDEEEGPVTLTLPPAALNGHFNNQGELHNDDYFGECVQETFTISGYKWNDVDSNGIWDEDEGPFPNWPIVVHNANRSPNFTITIDSSDSDGETLNIPHGTYLIEVEGTWENGQRDVDAEWYSDDDWSTQFNKDDEYDVDNRQLDLVINDIDVDWGAYNDGSEDGVAHRYKNVWQIGGDVNFRIFEELDAWYNDNEGSLSVKLYLVDDELTHTDDEGYYAINVTEGEYQIVEGWHLWRPWISRQTFPTPGYCHISTDDQDLTCDFGNFMHNVIFIEHLEDIDNNNLYTWDVDPRFGNWTYRIYDDQWRLVSEENSTDGYLKTSMIEPGLYYLCEVAQPGYEYAYPTLAHTGGVANEGPAEDEYEVCYENAMHTMSRSIKFWFGTAPQDDVCEEEFTIVSDEETMVGESNAQALTFVHQAWTADIPGATWIWESDPVQNPGEEETYNFTRTFEIEGSPLSGILDIASDNSYTVWLNGIPVGNDSAEDNFRINTQDQHDISSALQSGTNTLTIQVTNFARPGSVATGNPAGLLYKLTLAQECEEPEPVCDEFVTLQGAPYPVTFVESHDQGTQKGGAAVKAERSDPAQALIYEPGRSESHFYGLGFGGSITLEFQNPAQNGPGDDIRVVEDTWGSFPLETADVEASNDGVTWTLLGEANNQDPDHTFNDFDLGPLEEARFIRVTDTSDPDNFADSADAFDVNAVLALQDYQICADQCIVNESASVISDETSSIIETGSNAVFAWEPFSNSEPSVWDTGIDYDFTTSGADWIWESFRSQNPVEGDIIHVKKTFTLDGIPESGVLHVTADNGYEAWLNGHLVGSAGVAGEWQTSDLTEAFVHSQGWQTVEEYSVTSFLQQGENTLVVVVANEHYSTEDTESENGTIDNNPAGVIFELHTNTTKDICMPEEPVDVEDCRNYTVNITGVNPNATLPNGSVMVNGTLVNGNSDVDTEIVHLSLGGVSQPVGVLMGSWMATLQAPDGPGSHDVMVQHISACGDVSSDTETVEVLSDTDGDGVSDGEDNCAETSNPGQEDNDNDGLGDACDPDDDNDGVTDSGNETQAPDNCQFIPNEDQADNDEDGAGNACDSDDDNDGVPDEGDEEIEGDNCPLTSNPDQTDTDGDGLGDVCDDDKDNDGIPNSSDACELDSENECESSFSGRRKFFVSTPLQSPPAEGSRNAPQPSVTGDSGDDEPEEEETSDDETQGNLLTGAVTGGGLGAAAWLWILLALIGLLTGGYSYYRWRS